jgi:hypothetical protein
MHAAFTLRTSRLALATALVAASTALAGCGGSSHDPGTTGATARTTATPSTTAGTTATPSATVRTTATPSGVGCAVGAQACITQSPQATVLGSTNLDVNLMALIGHDQHTLLRPRVACHSSTAYPFVCRFSAVDTTRHQTMVTGTVKILGVYTLTHTYVYQLNYGASAVNPGGTRKPPRGGAQSGSTGL